ncbi:MAG: ferrous iron transport protein A, partial [Flavobacteriaceae bacterium CG17_big_fil_post_rev_8_21_14_2_50_33_15]
MEDTLANIKRGERCIITDVSSIHIPLKLLEMGCLPGN